MTNIKAVFIGVANKDGELKAVLMPVPDGANPEEVRLQGARELKHGDRMRAFNALGASALDDRMHKLSERPEASGTVDELKRAQQALARHKSAVH
jgi:hypothetical protein